MYYCTSSKYIVTFTQNFLKNMLVFVWNHYNNNYILEHIKTNVTCLSIKNMLIVLPENIAPETEPHA